MTSRDDLAAGGGLPGVACPEAARLRLFAPRPRAQRSAPMTSASDSPVSSSAPLSASRTGGGANPSRLADDSGQGKTPIASGVVQKIAGIAAREVSGVYSMGGGVSRAFGAIRERIPGAP